MKKEDMKKAILILAILGDPTIPPGLPNSGGFNQTVSNLLSNLGMDDEIILITDSNGLNNRNQFEIFNNNIELYRVNTSLNEVNNQELLYNSSERILCDIEDIINKCKREIKLIHTFYWFSGFLGSKLSEILNVPFIHTVISLFIYRRNAGITVKSTIQFECEKTFLPHAKAIFAITEDEKKLLTKYYDLDEKNIFVTGRNVSSVYYSPARDMNNIPRNLNDKKYFPNLLNQSRYTEWWKQQAFIYLGRMVPIKGVEIIIQAWIKTYEIFGKLTPALWLIGGSLEEIEKMRSSFKDIAKYECTGKLIWWGYLDAPSISTLLLKACALVVHSLYEPGGRVILEAFCQGIPVISTQCGFAKDYIYSGYNGYLVEYGDINSLSKRMAYFANNPYISNYLGENAKNYFNELNIYWDYFNTHKAVYQSFLKDQGKLPLAKRKLEPINIDDKSIYEKLNQFPYMDISYNIEEIVEDIRNQGIYTGTSHIKLCNHVKGGLYSFNYTGSDYLIQTIYNRISYDSIWNTFINKKGITVPKQIKRFTESMKFEGVLKPVYISEQKFYFLFKANKATKCSLAEVFRILNKFYLNNNLNCNDDYKYENSFSNHQLLKISVNYQEKNGFPFLPPYSLKIFFATLRYHIKLYDITIFEEVKFDNLYDLICRTENLNPKGINYGASLKDNIFLDVNNTLKLYPTDCWYYGERGADIVNSILESDTADYLLNKGKNIFGINHFRLLLWQSVILIYKIFLSEWELKDKSQQNCDLLEKTLDYVFSIK